MAAFVRVALTGIDSTCPLSEIWSQALSVTMISEFESKLIDLVQYQEDLSVCEKLVADSNNPFFLREYAGSYNWNDGIELPERLQKYIYGRSSSIGVGFGN